ncbi:MAG: hypothetical protein FJ220_04835, partial [Kiritimatiellaceae bacterium]|nr:hypothetical protein [Kiritimatiellaceae bacterium]
MNVTQIPYDEKLSKKRMAYNSSTPWTIALCVLRDGTPLLVVEQSLVRWVNGAWDVVMENVGSAENSFVERLMQTKDGTVWLMMPNQLIRFSEDLKEHRVVMETAGRDQLAAFCHDARGDLWVVEAGLDQAQLVHLSYSADRSSLVPVRRSFPIPFYQPTREIRLVAGQDGLIWCADSSGDTEFQVFDPKKGEWVVKERTGIGKGYYSLFKSRDGTLWAGGHGFLLAHRRGQELFYPAVQLGLPAIPLSLYEISDGRYWVIGRIGQVYSVDVSKSEWMTYQRLSYQAESTTGTQWFIEKNRSLIVSCDPSSGRWTQHGYEDHGLESVDRLILTRHG